MKHEQSQYLCESIEAARPHIPFPIKTHLAEVFPDIPVMIVHRVHRYKVASNYPYVESLELIATISVNDENRLNIWNNTSDVEGVDFEALSRPLIYPEEYAQVNA